MKTNHPNRHKHVPLPQQREIKIVTKYVLPTIVNHYITQCIIILDGC